jgi:hypothetical protein
MHVAIYVRDQEQMSVDRRLVVKRQTLKELFQLGSGNVLLTTIGSVFALAVPSTVRRRSQRE